VTYFPDGTPYRYLGDEPETVNIGWLDGDRPFPTATPSEPFLAALAHVCRRAVNHYVAEHRYQPPSAYEAAGLQQPLPE
jgi:hypothetical protein